jgi:phage/plasmid-associated DNA primase
MDLLADFLAESCILVPAAEVMAADLYRAYTDWADSSGIKKPMSQTELGRRLKERNLDNPQETKGHT